MRNSKTTFIAEKLAKKENIIIDFVGDSITWGLSHCTAEQTYVACFAKLFYKKYTDYDVVRYDGVVLSEGLPIERFDGPFTVGESRRGPRAVIIRNGVGGNTVRRAIDRILDFTGILPGGRKADVTFFMFGINDALFGDPFKYVSPAKFRENYIELLDRVEEDNGGLKIVITPTFNGNCPLNDYVETAKSVAAGCGAPVIDAHALWMKHFVKGGEHSGQGVWLSECEGDTCHPSPEGALETAKYIFDEFLKIINDKK